MSTIPTLSLRSTADLVATMPYLLGYHPRDALVLVCLRAGRIALTACQPLLPGGEPPPVLDALLAGMAKADPEAVIILGYENTTPVAGITRAAAQVCAEVGVPVHDRIIVTANGWQSMNSGDGTGSPAGSTSAVAELVGAGIAPLPSRDALTAAVQPTGDEAWVARHLARYTARGDDPDLLDLYCSAWPVVLDTGDDAPTVTPKVAARAVLALASIPVRDLVVARLTPGTLDISAIPGHAGALLRTLPAPPWETESGWDLIRTCARPAGPAGPAVRDDPGQPRRPTAERARLVGVVARRRGPGPGRPRPGAELRRGVPPRAAARADGRPGHPAPQVATPPPRNHLRPAAHAVGLSHARSKDPKHHGGSLPRSAHQHTCESVLRVLRPEAESQSLHHHQRKREQHHEHSHV